MNNDTQQKLYRFEIRNSELPKPPEEKPDAMKNKIRTAIEDRLQQRKLAKSIGEFWE